MAASLSKWPTYAGDQTRRVEGVFSEMRSTLPPSTQFLLAEILVLRLAQVLEEVLPEVFCRLVCGAKYHDGKAANRLAAASSVANAEQLMRKFNRTKERRNLKWLNAKDIRGNLEKLLDPGESALAVVDRYTNELDELRAVRNHAAHRVKGTKNAYRNVLSAYYGTSTITVPVGKFLVSDRFGIPPLVKYSVVVRALVKEVCGAP
jgi:hypothetical protein